jgi:hypothetical protein
MNIYFTGDDIAMTGALTKNDAPIPGGISGGTITVALLLPDRSGYAAGTGDVTATITDPVACTWSATWPRATTGAIVPGQYLVAAQMTLAGKVTSFPETKIEIRNGARPA